MTTIHQLVSGFALAFTLQCLLAAFLGALLGTAVGVLPGLSPTVVIALLLVPSARLGAQPGIVLLVAIYFGTQYGDSVSAILMGVPSEPPAMAVGMSGYQMTRRGRAGAAVVLAAAGAFCGAIIGVVGLLIFGKLFSGLVFSFGPVEIAALTMAGLVVLCRATGSSVSRALVGVGFGLMLSTIGPDPTHAIPRFTGGITLLTQGISLIPMILGLVGMAEVIEIAISPARLAIGRRLHMKELMPTAQEWRAGSSASLRGAGLGFPLGLVPGPSLTIAAFASRRLESALARRRGLSLGDAEGVAGPKAADDAAVSGNLASLLTIGIPFTPVTGVLYAGFLLHGIHPGPLLFKNSPVLIFGLIASIVIANIALVIMNIPFINVWMRFLSIPAPVLAALLALLILIGSFSVRESEFDMLVTVIAGILGCLLRRMNINVTLVIMALILGPDIESGVIQALAINNGNPLIFLTRPISLVLVLIMVAAVLGPRMMAGLRWTVRWAGASG